MSGLIWFVVGLVLGLFTIPLGCFVLACLDLLQQAPEWGWRRVLEGRIGRQQAMLENSHHNNERLREELTRLQKARSR